MATISILEIVEDTTVDGPGFRTSIYAAGCPNQCPGCHNPQSWDIANGTPMTTEEILPTILADPFADVTFSGGDPMFQAEGFTELAQAIKTQTHKNIWCYTGYRFEQLLQHPKRRALVELCDVVVDGPYIEAERDLSLRFRGSRNQRIIDVKRSLAGEVCLFEEAI